MRVISLSFTSRCFDVCFLSSAYDLTNYELKGDEDELIPQNLRVILESKDILKTGVNITSTLQSLSLSSLRALIRHVTQTMLKGCTNTTTSYHKASSSSVILKT